MAASVGIPDCSVMTWRTVLPAEGSTSPSSMFLTGTLRRISRVCRTSQTAPTLKASSAVRTSVLSVLTKSIAALEPLKS